jgi:hypothetical protein
VALAAARRVLDADETLNSADAMDALVARHGQARIRNLGLVLLPLLTR